MKYQAIIHPSAEGGYWAEVPALPGCAKQGETKAELQRNLCEAIAGWLDLYDHRLVLMARAKNAGKLTYSTTKVRAQLGLGPVGAGVPTPRMRPTAKPRAPVAGVADPGPRQRRAPGAATTATTRRVQGGKRLQPCFRPEPFLARTGRGFMAPAGVAKSGRLKNIAPHK